MSQELTEVERRVEENVQLLGRVPSPMLEQFPHTVYTTVDDVLRTLQDALSQKQWLQAVQLLRAARLVPHALTDYMYVYKYKNEVGCRDDTVPKTIDTRRHCEED